MLNRILKVVSNVILAIVLCVGVLIVLSLSNIPKGFKMLTVMSGSMEPALHTGSIIFVKSMQNYAIGDIVTRKTDNPKMTITHRITEKEEINGQIEFKTKGDANNSTDGESFTQDRIVGKELLAITNFGYIITFAKTQPGILLLIIIPSVIFIYEEINNITKEFQKLRKRKIETKGTFSFEDKQVEPITTNVHPHPKKIV